MPQRVRLASISRSSSEAPLNWTPDTLTDSTCGAMPSVMPKLELAACLLEHPMAERQHRAGPLGDRNEGGGREQAARLVVPPDQRLEPDDASRGELDLRLVVELELALLQRDS